MIGFSIGSGNRVAIGSPGSTITVNLSVVSAISTALIPGRTYRFWSSVDCFLKFGGASVVATTTEMPLTGKIQDYFTPAPGGFDGLYPVGDPVHVAGVVSSGTGVLFITEMT